MVLEEVTFILKTFSIDTDLKHTFIVYDYKVVEPFIRNDMSEESKEVNMRMLDKLWVGFSEKLKVGTESGSINRYGVGFARSPRNKGRFCSTAIENNLVDELLTWDQARVGFGDRVGFQEDESINRIDYQSYLRLKVQISVLL